MARREKDCGQKAEELVALDLSYAGFQKVDLSKVCKGSCAFSFRLISIYLQYTKLEYLLLRGNRLATLKGSGIFDLSQPEGAGPEG